MENIFSKLSRIDFPNRFNVLLSQNTVPKIKTLAFVYAESTRSFLHNHYFAAYTKSAYGNGYWLINPSLHKAKLLSDNQPFFFGYIHNSELVLISYTWENETVKEIKRFVINGKSNSSSYEIPFFSDGKYMTEASKADIVFKEDIVLTIKAQRIIKKCHKTLDDLLGTTPEDYLNEKPIKVGIGTVGMYGKMSSCVNDIYESYSEKIVRENIHILDFDKISRNKNLSENFILEHMNELSMRKVLEKVRLSEEFIKQNYDKINHRYLFQRQKLSEAFIEELSEKLKTDDWRIISYTQKLSENFIRKHKDRVDWDSISSSQKLSMNFIREFQDKVDWSSISWTQNLNMKFIREFQDRINYKRINQQKLSKNFILKNIEKLDLYLISKRQEHLTPALRDKLLLLGYLT